ncbi:hypothetical protein [Candidatus Uabimicrobium sp. HlEnr_7]|uniref:hypothetical protein n=1 Tax=Candidatus Uabimicrobium helgolandensis TaxID=3095367 RepID=UPI00355928DC
MISKLPLLQKELIEYASTKRIYILRVLYGICLYVIFLVNWSQYTSYDNLYQVLGSGRWLLEYIFATNTGAIYIILPMISSIVVTNEKEKRTLSLLLTTKLGPGLILFEKFLGLVLSMFYFLLMSFPIIYMTYLLGGLTNKKIFLSLYIQFLTIAQVAAIGLFFSCYCKTSIKAIMSTYIWGFILYAFLPFFDIFTNISNYGEIMLFPPGFYFYLDRYSLNSWDILSYTLPIWITILLALLGARHLLIRYPRKINQKPLAVRVREDFKLDRHKTPRIHLPLLWREGTHNTWGLSAKIFFGVGVVIAIAIIGNLPDSRHRRNEMAMIIYFFGLAIAALFLAMKSVSLFQREIKQETWDVLLTTTIKTESIFFQKTMALTKFTIYICTLLVIVYSFNIAAFHRYNYYNVRLSTGAKWIYSLIFTFLIFSIIQWSMTWLGLVFKRNRRIAFVAIGIIVSWCLLPILASEFSRDIFGGSRGDYRIFSLFSPFAIFVFVTEGRIPHFRGEGAYTALNLSLLIYLAMAAICFASAYFSSKKHIRVCD